MNILDVYKSTFVVNYKSKEGRFVPVEISLTRGNDKLDFRSYVLSEEVSSEESFQILKEICQDLITLYADFPKMVMIVIDQPEKSVTLSAKGSTAKCKNLFWKIIFAIGELESL